MQHVEHPIFIVGYRGTYVTDARSRGSVNAFGTPDKAEAFARESARQREHNLSDYTVARFEFSGDETEVRA